MCSSDLVEIQALKAQTDYKNAWRRAPAERKFYSHRLVFYKQIKSLAKELTVSETVAAENLERSRLAANKLLKQLFQLTIEYYGQYMDNVLHAGSDNTTPRKLMPGASSIPW